jgi:hypothetical protein
VGTLVAQALAEQAGKNRAEQRRENYRQIYAFHA